MLQLIDKSNDRFQLAYGINSGVLVHVETVVLMSRVKD
jgi:hypothetical protein